MKSQSLFLALILLLFCGCEDDYNGNIIGQWQMYEVIEGEKVFEMPVTWSDKFGTFKYFITFNADNAGNSEYIIDGESWGINEFEYEVNKNTIIFWHAIDDGFDPPDTTEYSIDDNILTLGKGTFIRE